MNTVLHNILLILRSDRERGLRRRPSPAASIWITTLRCRVLASATSRKPRGAHERKSKYRDVVEWLNHHRLRDFQPDGDTMSPSGRTYSHSHRVISLDGGVRSPCRPAFD